MPYIFSVKVVPSSGRSLFHLDKSGRLKCYLKSAPERGAANDELIKLIARTLKIPQSDVQIISGAIARDKMIKIPLDIDQKALLTMLGIEQQMSIVAK